MAKNANLHKAKVAKNDEFYTQRVDIENELSHYAEHFRDKVVYCNCDDPETSEFWLFFKRNFKPWGLKRLIATHYEPDAKNYAYVLEISQDTNGDGVVDWKDDPTTTPLPCNGDFRSAACIELLKQADIVVTNPPFSLFREYMAQLIEYDKKFLIIGNPNAITYKEFFPLIKNNLVWIGHKSMGTDMLFKTTKEYESELRQNKKEGSGYKIINGEFYARAAAIWYTNLDIPKRHIPLDLRGNHYYGNEDKYPKYDNYDAIECSKVSDIPCDYVPCWYSCEHAKKCEYAQKEGMSEAAALCESACNGILGVPITYLDLHCENQFEIIGISSKDNCGNVPRLKENSYYSGYTRGKVITRVESNMPLIANPSAGGTKCSKHDFPDIYQLYWRVFIRKNKE